MAIEHLSELMISERAFVYERELLCADEGKSFQAEGTVPVKALRQV